MSVTPYISAFLGIAFWLRVSRILEPAVRSSSLVRYMGRNTFPIMMHHMMVFLGIKTAYALLARQGGIFAGFDFAAYKTDFYYCYLPRGIVQLKVFYLAAGLFLPLIFKRLEDKGSDFFGRFVYNGRKRKEG